MIMDEAVMRGISPAEAKAALSARMASSEPIRLPADMQSLITLVETAQGAWRAISSAPGHVVVLGWDHTALDTIARWLGVEIDAERAAELRVIEAEFMAIVRERSA